MKHLSKSAFFNPLLLALMVVAGLIIAAKYSDLADHAVPSSVRQTVNIVEAEVSAPTWSNTADSQQSKSFGRVRNEVATSAVVSSSVQAARPSSPGPSTSLDVEVATPDDGYTGKRSLNADIGELFPSNPSANLEGAGFAIGATLGTDLVIPVPPGVKVPALFLDETPRPVPQQKMLDRMAAEFNEAVSNPPPGVSAEEAWEQARLHADEKYLKLFGYAAYNAYHLQAAIEAVKEKKALQASLPPTQ
jgi:hypothetical protein